MDAARELKRSMGALFRGLFPDLFLRAQGPIYARVLKVREPTGTATPLEPRYSVDVRPLTADLDEDPSWPDLPDVELQQLWAGPGRGVWCSPEVGAIVRVGFMYGDPGRPYIEGLTGYGYSVPAHPSARFLVQSGAAKVEITTSGDIVIQGGQIVAEGNVKLGSSVAFKAVVLTSCPCPMVPFPGDGHLVGAMKVKAI